MAPLLAELQELKHRHDAEGVVSLIVRDAEELPVSRPALANGVPSQTWMHFPGPMPLTRQAKICP